MEDQRSQIIARTTKTNGDVTTWKLPEGAIARLGRGIIADLVFSPDGESLAIATTVGVWIYELATMKPITLLETERGLVSTISFSPNRQWIATSNWDGIIKVWETETQRCTAKIQGWHGGTSQLAFSPDSQYLAASGKGYGDVYVWNAETGMHVASFPVVGTPKKGERLPTSFPVCFSPDGQCIAYVSGRSTLAVRHIETKEHIAILKRSPRKQIQGLAFSPCGRFLAVGSQNTSTNRQNTELQVWDLDNETVEMIDSDYDGDKLIPAYSSDGTLRVADLYKDKAMLWEASRREKLNTFEYGRRAKKTFRFSSDGQQFAIATECEVRVWDTDMPSTVVSHLEHTRMVRTLFFIQGGKTLVSGYGGESGLVFWDVAQKRARQILSPSYGRCAISPSEEILATAVGENGETIEVLQVVSGKPIATLTKHQRYVTALAFSPTGEHLVSGDEDGNLFVWSVEPWRELQELIGHTNGITTAVFHPNGSHVITASRDHTTRVWDFESGERLASLPMEEASDISLYKGDQRQIRRIFNRLSQGYSHKSTLHSITFSPSGDIIAGGLHREIRLWDATTYETRMAIIPPDTCQRPNVVIFSPCGRYFVSGSWWQEGQEKVSIRLWEVSTGENIATFWSHPTDIQYLAFSSDGALLASGSFDGTILLWDMKPFIDA
ncbi:WD40 repeat domain-containing protein [Candidatus Poribacteria bacterium]|nr:WD40 repeat domain-containing protein [Candidatus Poribacteria bacterium]